GDASTATASLGLDVVANRYVKGPDGIWRIREMRVFPIMATDYYSGWAKSRLVTPPPDAELAPDAAVPPGDRGTLTEGVIPVLLEKNPVTGKAVPAPAGTRFAGVDPLLPTLPPRPRSARTPSDLHAALADAERRLSLSVAYVAVDNISHA